MIVRCVRALRELEGARVQIRYIISSSGLEANWGRIWRRRRSVQADRRAVKQISKDGVGVGVGLGLRLEVRLGLGRGDRNCNQQMLFVCVCVWEGRGVGCWLATSRTSGISVEGGEWGFI